MMSIENIDVAVLLSVPKNIGDFHIQLTHNYIFTLNLTHSHEFKLRTNLCQQVLSLFANISGSLLKQKKKLNQISFL